MYRNQFGEFVCGYWGLKGYEMSDIRRLISDNKHQTSDIRRLTSDNKHQTSDIRHQMSDI